MKHRLLTGSQPHQLLPARQQIERRDELVRDYCVTASDLNKLLFRDRQSASFRDHTAGPSG